MTAVRILFCAIAMLGVAVVAPAQPPTPALAARAAEGQAAMKAGEFDQAATIYAELVKARPADAGLLLNLGMARYMAGDAQHALAPLQRAVKLKPGLAPASLFLGASLLQLGRIADAVPPLERAVATMPNNADAREMLGRAKLALGRYSSAITELRAMAALDPQSAKAWYGLARAYQGLAEEAFAALQRDSPDSPLLSLLLADVLVVQEKYAGALGLYRKALAANVPVGGVHEAIAELYELSGHDDWAAIESKRAAPRSAAFCATRRAECEYLAGRTSAALAAARSDKTAVGRYWTVRAANHLATEAVSRLEALPPSIEVHLLRAEVAQSRGRHPDAISEIRAALALAPGDHAIESALAEALVRARNFGEALPLLERLTREQPDSAELLYLHGEALLQSQQVEPAIPILERALQSDPNALPVRASLGRALALVGRFAEALPHLEAAAADDEDGDLHYQLARAYQSLQRPDDARRAMQEYQRLRQPASEEVPTGQAESQVTPP
jgi:predicted Zn-dependent protease